MIETWLDKIQKCAATVCFTGYSPFAPGTVGTLAAVLFYLLMKELSLPYYLVLTCLLFIVGVIVSGKIEQLVEKKDPSIVVIDEFVGYLVTMVLLPPTKSYIVAGFLVFRFFDIFKPPPVRWIDQHIQGGWGIMLDDLLAAVYSNIILQVFHRII